MYNAQSLVYHIKQKAKQKNIHIKDMLKACDLNINALSQISDKKGLSSFSLARIADYLDCSVDYLLGRTNEYTKITGSNIVAAKIKDTNIQSDIIEDTSIMGVNIENTNIGSTHKRRNNTELTITENEAELLDIYRSLNLHDKTTLMNFVFEMQDKAAKA